MTDKRLLLALAPLGLLAACGGETPADDGRSASGEVLEGTISDAMLPLARVRSEPPAENPEAFEEARSAAREGAAPALADDQEAGTAEAPTDQTEETPADEAEPDAEG